MARLGSAWKNTREIQTSFHVTKFCLPAIFRKRRISRQSSGTVRHRSGPLNSHSDSSENSAKVGE